MDQSFFLRAQRLLGEPRHAVPDHDTLVAALSAHQSASPTAQAEKKACAAEEAGVPHDPLPELILGGRRWREAAAAQQGCFNRSIVSRPVNGS